MLVSNYVKWLAHAAKLIKTWKKRRIVPLTAREAEKLVPPAALLATQVYSPAWLAVTASIVSRLTRLLVTTVISEKSWEIGWPLSAHSICIGWSPFRMVHVAVTVSPQFAGFSLIAKGAISGATKVNKVSDRVTRLIYSELPRGSIGRMNDKVKHSVYNPTTFSKTAIDHRRRYFGGDDNERVMSDERRRRFKGECTGNLSGEMYRSQLEAPNDWSLRLYSTPSTCIPLRVSRPRTRCWGCYSSALSPRY